MKQLRAVLSAIMVGTIGLGTGCTTMDRGYQGVTKTTNPGKMELKSGLRWMKPQPALREVSGSKMKAYIRVRNSSASPAPVDVLAVKLRDALTSAGYQVVTNKDDAHFTLNADIRFYGENENKDLGAGGLASAVAGGVAGAVIGHQVHHSNTSTAIGAAAGAAVAGGMAKIMANRNPMVEIDLVVDLRIGERMRGEVTTTRKTEESSHSTQMAGINTGGGHEGGNSRESSIEEQKIELKEDFLYHKNRLVAHATKMSLTPDEAMPVLVDKMAMALSSVLP